MGISLEDWKHIISTRSDMSSYVTHLTRESDIGNAFETLLQIIKDEKLIGSNNKGFIQGSDRAVCFQDAPLSGIVQNVYHNQKQVEDGKTNKYRYRVWFIVF